MSDNVNHPSHYADGWSNGAEVIDITEHLDFNRGNAVKYLARAGKKGGSKGKELEDLRKAQWYVERAIAKLETESVAELDAQMSKFDVPREYHYSPGGVIGPVSGGGGGGGYPYIPPLVTTRFLPGEAPPVPRYVHHRAEEGGIEGSYLP